MELPQTNTSLAPISNQDVYKQKVDKVGDEFESFFTYQVLELMQPKLENKVMSGGRGEEMFKHILNEHMANAITKQGGIGIADNIKAQLLKYQEVAK